MAPIQMGRSGKHLVLAQVGYIIFGTNMCWVGHLIYVWVGYFYSILFCIVHTMLQINISIELHPGELKYFILTWYIGFNWFAGYTVCL